MIINSVSSKTGVKILWSSHSTFSCCQRKAELQTTCKPVGCTYFLGHPLYFPLFYNSRQNSVTLLHIGILLRQPICLYIYTYI